MPLAGSYDYVIAGAGSAGCLLGIVFVEIRILRGIDGAFDAGDGVVQLRCSEYTARFLKDFLGFSSGLHERLGMLA